MINTEAESEEQVLGLANEQASNDNSGSTENHVT